MPSVEITTPDTGGVKLTSPADRGFDDQLKALHGENAPLVAELKPWLVLLSNESPHKVVAYTTMSFVPRQRGRGTRRSCHFRYPDAVGSNSFLPRGREVLPGERRVIALCGWEIDPATQDFGFYSRQFVRILKDQFPDSVDVVEVSLDAVIFENGFLMGPDTTGSGGNFLDCLAAKRELAKTLLDSADPAERIRSVLQETSPSLQNGEWARRREMLWRRLAIEDAHRLLLHSGEANLVAAMKETLRQEPFVIRNT